MSKRALRSLFLVAFVAIWAPSALAEQFVAVSNVGGPIPASGTGGQGAVWPASLPANPAVSPLLVSHEVGSVTAVRILGLSHSSAGDLHAVLRAPSGTRYNLFVRSGFDGASVWNQGDFVAADVGIVSSGLFSFPGGANTPITTGTYTQDFGNTGSPPAPWPSGLANIHNVSLNSVNQLAGTWELMIFDWNTGEVGSFTGWTLTGLRPSIEPFCPGDGTLGPCPCGNLGAPGRGCNNSSNTGGAQLTAAGTFTPDTIVLTVTGTRPNSLVIFLQGGLGNALPFGDGSSCLAGTLQRLYNRTAVGGTASAPGPGDPTIRQRSAALGSTVGHGATRRYQAFYRDANATFCPPNTFNVSSGVSITWP